MPRSPIRVSVRSFGPGILLIALAAVCWVTSAARMTGMDAGPGAGLGATGWFMATWVVMMAAMMLPVIAPLAVRYLHRYDGRAAAAALVQGGAFVGAYLAVWAAAGLLAYELVSAGRSLLAGALAWEHGGRWAAVVMLGAAGTYQLTSPKRRSLQRCRQTSGSSGAVAGLRAGVNCLSSSWVMMAALFALGVMSLWWMALVAALIAAERLPRDSTPGRRVASVVFLALALGLAAAPTAVPGLTVPGSAAGMKPMPRMSPDAPMGRMSPSAASGRPASGMGAGGRALK